MKPIILIAGGLIVGLGGGTVASALRVKGEVEAELAARADSIAALELELGGVGGHDDGSTALAGLDDHGDGAEDGPALDGSETGDSIPLEEDAGHGDDPITATELDDTTPAPEVEDAVGADVPADSTGTPATTTGETGSGDSLTRTNTPVPGSAEIAANGTDGPAVTAEGARRMAKIFAAMRAADAAGVMAELGDREVAAILNELNDRQAAAILGQFDAERAARLGRLMLGGGGR